MSDATLGAIPAARPSLPRFPNLMRRLKAAIYAHQTREALSRLSDRELRDIGLTRYDIHRIAEEARQSALNA